MGRLAAAATDTETILAPSGEICGEAIQRKAYRSVSAMGRLAAAATDTETIARAARRRRGECIRSIRSQERQRGRGPPADHGAAPPTQPAYTNICESSASNVLMETFWMDLKHAFRMLRQSPGFTATAISALALGIGANTAIFSVVNTVLLKPLAFPEPERIVVLETSSSQGSGPGASVPKYNAWRRQTQVLEDVSAYDPGGPGLNLGGGDHPEQLKGIHVSYEFFHLFGAQAVVGRTFTAAEDRPRGGNVIVLSNGLWRRRILHRDRRARARLHLRSDAGRVSPVPGRSGEHQSGPLLPGRGAAEAGRFAERRESRPEADGRGVQTPVSRGHGTHQQLHGGAYATASGEQPAHRAFRAAGRGRRRAGHRLRERGQPAAGARHRTGAGDRHPLGHWRGPRTHRAATADGKRAALDGRRLGGPRDRRAGGARVAGRESGQHSAHWAGRLRSVARLDRDGLHAAAVAGHGHPVRAGSGDAGFARGPEHHAEGDGRAGWLRHAAEQDARGAGDGRDGAGDSSADRRGAADPHVFGSA